MEEMIEELYQKLIRITSGYLIYQRRDNVDEIKEIMPQIQQFVLWFLEGNRFGIEEEEYLGLGNNLVGILEDILTAMEQKDKVLLHDAVAHGLLEYLELFTASEEEMEDDTV